MTKLALRGQTIAIAIFGMLVSPWLAGSHAAFAEELSDHGLFSLEIIADGEYQGISLPQDEIGELYRYTLDVTNTDGGGFMDGGKGWCVTIVYFTNAPEHQTGFCVTKDGDGDEVLQHMHRSDAIGVAEFVSGTGKYEGIKGRAEYIIAGDVQRDEGVYAGKTLMNGSYQLAPHAVIGATGSIGEQEAVGQ
jgi:hypothetical protein